MNSVVLKLPKGLTVRGSSIFAKVSVTVKGEEKRQAKSFKFVDVKTTDLEMNFVEAREKAILWKREITEALTLGKEMLPQKNKVMTLKEGADYTYDTKWSANKSPDTPYNNAKILMRFFGENKRVNEIDGIQINDFVKQRINRDKVADGTVNRQLVALSTILKTCFHSGYYSKDGSVPPKMPLRKEYANRVRIFSREEEILFQEVCNRKGEPYQLLWDIVLIALRTGLRRGEFISLQRRDVFDDGNRLHITLAPIDTKGGRTRTVTATGSARIALLKHMTGKEQSALIFDDITEDEISHRFATVRGLMGLGNDEQFSFHCARHTNLSRLSERGMPAKAIMDWAGHTLLSTTQRYIHPSQDALAKGADLMAEYDVPVDVVDFAKDGATTTTPGTVAKNKPEHLRVVK